MSDFDSTRRSQPAPTSGVLAIVLAVVAVVAGFLILRSIDGNDDGATAVSGGAAEGAAGSAGDDSGSAAGGDATTGSSSTSSTSSTSTLPPMTYTGAKVVVANANGQAGSAGQITTVIASGTDFEMAEATNATTGNLETSQIQYDSSNAAAQAVAESLARVLPGNLTPTAISGTAPVADGNLNGAGVLLLAGLDLVDLNVAKLTIPADPAAPSQTAPPVAGAASTSAPAG